MKSLVIPVYKNEGSIPDLLAALEELNRTVGGDLEVVFVVDGSPDRSFPILRAKLPACGFASKLLLLSRNFGSFAAIRVGLREARGPLYAVMAADLQEPPELVHEFFQILERDEADLTLGVRRGRDDPFLSRMYSAVFWAVYRRFVQPEMPAGGVDMFGCNQAFRDQLLELAESNSSLVGLLIWLGYRRREVGYHRRARKHGKSAWTFGKKLRYLTDSIFAFSDLPIRLLVSLGLLGIVFSVCFSLVVVGLKVSNLVPVPGYAATVLIISFFAALNSLGLGLIGSYVWRAFENTKGRPQALLMTRLEFEAAADAEHARNSGTSSNAPAKEAPTSHGVLSASAGPV